MAADLSPSTVASALDAVVARAGTTLSALDEEFPFVADQETGAWQTTPDGDGCAGHWIGLLGLASAHADDGDRFADAAREYADRYLELGDQEWMFAGMITSHAGFDVYDLTGERIAFGIGFMGADAMCDLFDERARQIPIGEIEIEGPDEEFEYRTDEGQAEISGDHVAAVDNVYATLPVLWRAYRESGDPHFRDVAVSHADRHLDLFLREDGRTWNLAHFDPDTGDPIARFNVLAASDETCWARGHAWNIAGLARAYAETGAGRYLDALDRCVAYYRDHAPPDLVPYWDFEAPSIPEEPRDTSAAAITANGLLAIDGDTGRTADLRAFGESVLASIVDEYLVLDEDDPRYGMVTDGCYDRPSDYAIHNELIWTDFYVARALHCLATAG